MQTSRFRFAFYLALAVAAPTFLTACFTNAPARPDVSTAGVAEQQQLTNGADLINRLNVRYQNTVNACEDRTPPFRCSGLLLRRSDFNSAYDFWTFSQAAIALQSVTFAFVRQDSSTNGNDINSGFIFMDHWRALTEAKTMPAARCIYPFMAGTQNANRPLHGCGFPDSQAGPRLDESTCFALPSPATNPALWIEYFKASNSELSKQCSLSIWNANQFITSLQVREQLSSIANTYGNELLITTWDESHPEELPIEAFFFNQAKAGAFESALKLREAYYKRTQILLPIVRLDFQAPDKKIVTPLTELQEGMQASNALNLRYASTRSDCLHFKASLDCNGVIIRTAQYAAGTHVWNPGEKHVKNNGVAFSYIRADSGINVLAWNTRYQGFIFKQLDSLREPGSYQLQAACIFPTDGATDFRTQACGAHKDYPTASETCASQGITTLAQFKTHFQTVPEESGYFYNRNRHQCSLPTSQAGVDISMKARNNDTLNPAQRAHHNELIIRAWPQNIPNQLPLEAFFWWNPNNDASGLAQAKDMQRDLVRTAAKWIPVVRVNFKTTNPDQIFMYAPEDQACTRTTCN